MVDPQQHAAASQHLPFFITAPGHTDVLLVIMAVVLVLSVLAAGVFFFWLHSLPERMVHNKVQFDIVAVLALISLFTHNHAFWVAALLIALITIPDFLLPHFSDSLKRIAGSLETMAKSGANVAGTSALPEAHTKPADAKALHQVRPKPADGKPSPQGAEQKSQSGAGGAAAERKG